MKAAVDHHINDHWQAGASVNLATSLKKSGSKNSIVNGFRMSPMMDAYYWDGDNAASSSVSRVRMSRYILTAVVLPQR